MNTQLMVPNSVADSLPSMVRNELAKLPASSQEEFVEEYKRRAKSTGTAYALWFFLGWHYAYIGKWGVQLLYWATGGGVLLWAIADLFRISGLVKNFNKDIAVDVMRNHRAIAS